MYLGTNLLTCSVPEPGDSSCLVVGNVEGGVRVGVCGRRRVFGGSLIGGSPGVGAVFNSSSIIFVGIRIRIHFGLGDHEEEGALGGRRSQEQDDRRHEDRDDL